MSTPAKTHQVWIDWCKALGMLTIIWGHCFPPMTSNFIYAFNVPVFFIISGFLTKREESMKVALHKIGNNLLIPYLILAFIKAAGSMLKHLDDGQWIWSVVAICGGFHSLHDVSGCSNLWFVYTLIIIKILYQGFASGKVQLLLMSIVAFVGALIYNAYSLDWMWAVTNVMLALPFFMLGNWVAIYRAEQFKAVFNYLKKRGTSLILPLILLTTAITAIVGYHNVDVDMFQNQYGNHFGLFLIGALSGSLMIFLYSVWLDKFDLPAVRITSIGTIVTLVFHRELLHPLLKIIRNSGGGIVAQNMEMFFSSVLVLIAFVPIILIVKRILPIVLGKRAK